MCSLHSGVDGRAEVQTLSYLISKLVEKLGAWGSLPGLGSSEARRPAAFQTTAVSHSWGRRPACIALFSQRHWGHGLEPSGSAVKQVMGKHRGL